MLPILEWFAKHQETRPPDCHKIFIFQACVWKLVRQYNNPWSHEYMKIIYENCGVKNYMKEDHRSYWRNFCSCEKKAWKNSGLYRIRTRDLYSTGAVQPC